MGVTVMHLTVMWDFEGDASPPNDCAYPPPPPPPPKKINSNNNKS